MDASKPMIRGMSIAEEYDELDRLFKECERFLRKWKAYGYTTEDGPADAFVAIFTLQVEVVARKSYILGLQHQGDVPF